MGIESETKVWASAIIKKHAIDWKVIEELESGRQEIIRKADSGEHLYLFIEKIGLNTTDVVDFLAKYFQVESSSIGYCGRKDKKAVTRQWFSVPTKQCLGEYTEVSAGIRVLDEGRFQKKLRIGEHAYNRFEIVLRQVDFVDSEFISKEPVCFLNFYGSQRYNDNSLLRAMDWIRNRRSRKVPQSVRSWNLSMLRSFLFNKILEQRKALGIIEGVIDGDPCTGPIPTAPLWGRGRSQTKGLALDIEIKALEPYQDICEALEYSGVQQGRRMIYQKPFSFNVECDTKKSRVETTFCLPVGAYATVFLGNYFQLIDASK
jgi:tRNA pseudouridine13 synthase